MLICCTMIMGSLLGQQEVAVPVNHKKISDSSKRFHYEAFAAEKNYGKVQIRAFRHSLQRNHGQKTKQRGKVVLRKCARELLDVDFGWGKMLYYLK